MSSELTDLLIKIGSGFMERKLSLVTVESCTAGGLAYQIAKVKECSPILERGFIAYSNIAKQQMLGVKPHTLCTHGAVSNEVAIEMAEGGLRNSNAHISIALTGIAGDPKKDNDEKIGIIWIACAGVNKPSKCIKKEIPGDREEFLENVIDEALLFLEEFALD